MGFEISGPVEANGNVEVNTPLDRADAGYIVSVFEQDAGSVNPDGATRRGPWVSRDLRLATGLDTSLFNDAFNATAQNTALWRYVFDTLTSTMGSGSVLMNSASTLTTLKGCQLSTWAVFDLLGSGGLCYESVGSFTAAPLANQVVEFGWMAHGTGVAAPTEGVFFRYTSAGLVGVLSFNGVEVTTSVLGGSISINQNYSFKIRLDQRGIDFIKDEIILASLAIPAANGFPVMTQSLPCSYQFRNAGTVSGSPVMQYKPASTNVVQRDLHTTRTWEISQSAQGQCAYQGQNGETMGSKALYTNSLAAGTGAAMTNTTAALGSGLGGQFAAQPTLAVATDGILCSYQNPAPTVNLQGRLLIVKGLWLKGVVTAAFTGGPVLYAYSLAFGHTAVSMATAETGSFVTATTKAPRRIPIGIETYVVTAPVGTLGQGVLVRFDSPIAVNPGEFIAICAKNQGTATSAGVICFNVGFDAYFE